MYKENIKCFHAHGEYYDASFILHEDVYYKLSEGSYEWVKEIPKNYREIKEVKIEKELPYFLIKKLEDKYNIKITI